MSDKPIIHIDSSEQRSDVLDYCPQYCPTCNSETESGFGLAGGGYGVYAYCSSCERIVGKVQVEE